MTTMQDSCRLLVKTLDILDEAPQPLLQAAAIAARYARVSPKALTHAVLRSALASADLNDPLQLQLSAAICRWEYVDKAEWTAGTLRNTQDRRDLIFKLLGLPASLEALFTARFPTTDVDRAVVIADIHNEWYPDPSVNNFYWKAYARYLAKSLGWHQNSINVLNESTTNIMERLSCPWRREAYQSKGLVVGYVQSGKTANFTGVAAKAVDSGYRLIIILSGLLDVLRNQTQRRIDRELIGKEILQNAPGGNEYAGDQDWPSFIEYGGLPSTFGSVDWHRLTGPEHDYMRLGKGVDALDLERQDRQLPLYARENLRAARARLLVVKKNPRVLERIIDDLDALRRTDLHSVPALIIDDESDQASIDTSKPDKTELRRRTATNKAIRKLLRMLPRAQYVGYTATPFANVFVDPNDREDIFPRDFIISLPRPPAGYMGVADFFDMSDLGPGATVATSNEKAFVRSVIGANDEPKNLKAAIESFLLAGALKLYRAAKRPSLSLGFRHHTMLVHSSAYKRVHKDDAKFVERQFNEVVKDATRMWKALEELYAEDFEPVSRFRGKGLPFPKRFEELRGHVSECRGRLEMGQLIRIVNGDNKDDTPNFDRDSIWSILVGGTKLSRGYTIEGLTTSYYRRASSTADTLMQMGRWFGFRKGYSDLVRLYLGRSEPLDKKGKRRLDLVEAFKGVCLDEEEFRADIKRYSAMGGKSRLRPVDVTPLVPSHLLRPTSANKMRYAKVRMMNFGRRWSEKTLAPTDPADMLRNQDLARALVESADPHLTTLEASVEQSLRRFDAVVGHATTEDVLSFLRGYKWSKDTFNVVQREIDFISKRSRDAGPGIDGWLIVAPQLQTRVGRQFAAGGLQLTVKERARISESGRFKAFSEPDHRLVTAYLCGVEPGTCLDPATLALKSSRQAGLLLYPVREDENAETSIGFAMVFPPNGIKPLLRWAVDSAGDRSEADA